VEWEPTITPLGESELTRTWNFLLYEKRNATPPRYVNSSPKGGTILENLLQGATVS